jgi:hypothetical protein
MGDTGDVLGGRSKLARKDLEDQPRRVSDEAFSPKQWTSYVSQHTTAQVDK